MSGEPARHAQEPRENHASGSGQGVEQGAVSPRAYARIHGVSIFTVWRWIREGHVEAEKLPNGYSWRVKLKKSTEQLRPTVTNCE